MLVYRPSTGNSSVTLNDQGAYTGYSIGGNVIERLPTGPSDYFIWVYSNISDDSSWFYKPITDLDVLNGNTYYRAFYIGPDERERVPEYIGTINSSVAVSSEAPTEASGSVNLSLWVEGVFTNLNAKDSLLLENESDTTSILPSSASFTSSVSINQVIPIGSWVKVWVKVNVTPTVLSNTSIPYSYVFTVGNVDITVLKDTSRLSLSKLFILDISKETPSYTFRELISESDIWTKTQKIIYKNDQTHVFYYDSTQTLFDLVIKGNLDINDNKYAEVNLSDITGVVRPTVKTGDISSSLYLIANDENYNCAEDTSASFDSPKRIIDIIETNLEDRNYFYVFFNQLKKTDDGVTISTSSTTFSKYYVNYGHEMYYWSTGVILLDLNTYKDDIFEDVSVGYDNRLQKILTSGTVYELKSHYYATSVIRQDDLFTLCGYDTESDPVDPPTFFGYGFRGFKAYNSSLIHLWEKDILKGDPIVQRVNLPATPASKINTISNKVITPNNLIISDWSSIISDTLEYPRSIKTCKNGVSYCDLGSPHGKKLKHLKDTSITYDIKDNLDEWSSTLSFRLGVATDASTASSTLYNQANVSNLHIIDSGTSSTTGVGFDLPIVISVSPSSTHTIALLCLNPKNSDYKALQIKYDIVNENLIIMKNDSNGIQLGYTVLPNTKILLGQENTITFNTTRNQVYDNDFCASRYLINYELYLNGVLVDTGTTYSLSTSNTLVLTYNYANKTNEAFSGSISYFEVKEHLADAVKYALNMYRIHSNLAWSRIGNSIPNVNIVDEVLQTFTYKRVIDFAPSECAYPLIPLKESILIPITLYGRGYAIPYATGSSINVEVMRILYDSTSDPVTFDFKDIDINTPYFTFTYLGSAHSIPWYADKYDSDNDKMTIWLRVEKWNGQKIVMYFNDKKSLKTITPINPFNKGSYYGVWVMDEFITTANNNYINQEIFNAGDAIIYSSNVNKYIVQVDTPYLFGYKKVYKSNYFNVEYDDRAVNYDEQDNLNTFIKSTVDLFKPDIMEINKVKSKYDYKLETDTTGE